MDQRNRRHGESAKPKNNAATHLKETTKKRPQEELRLEGFVQRETASTEEDKFTLRFSEMWQDVLTPQLPLRILFKPDKFCCCYCEHTVCGSMDTEDFIKHSLMYPHLLRDKSISRLCCYLSVCKEKAVFNTVRSLVLPTLVSGSYTPQWSHVRGILVNLGYTETELSFNRPAYYEIETPYGTPEVWNFQIVIDLIYYGFSKWEDRWVLAVLKFLCDCLFEVKLLECQNGICILICRVATWLMDRNHSIHDLVKVVDQSRNESCSEACNRHVVIQLSGHPSLEELTAQLRFKTVFDLLKTDKAERYSSCVTISTKLKEIAKSGRAMSVFDTQQLAHLTQNLVGSDFNNVEYQNHVKDVMEFVKYVDRELQSKEVSLEKSFYLDNMHMELEFFFQRKKCSTSLKKTTSRALAVDNHLFHKVIMPGIMRFTGDCSDIRCTHCSQLPTIPPATFVDHTYVEYFESHLRGGHGSGSITIAATSYVTEGRMLPATIISLFMATLLVDRISELGKLMTKSLLERHLFFHPPCRPGMHEYYLAVLRNELLLQGSIKSNFFTVITNLGVAFDEESIEGTDSEPHLSATHDSQDQPEQGIGKRKRYNVHWLMFMFNYFVDILYHDFIECHRYSKTPAVLKVVWSEDDLGYVNPHCTDVIQLYVTCPRAWRYDIGKYLSLLAGALHKREVSEAGTLLPIGENKLVNALFMRIRNKSDDIQWAELIGDIPSKAFQGAVHERERTFVAYPVF